MGGSEEGRERDTERGREGGRERERVFLGHCAVSAYYGLKIYMLVQ